MDRAKRRPNASHLLGCLLGWTLLACGAGTPATLAESNVVLVLVDTLRADRLGSYGHEADTSPFFDSLAARSVVFEDVTSASSHTVPAVVSLMSGLHPHRHGNQYFHLTRSFRRPLAGVPPRVGDSIPMLAHVFREAGYETLAVVTNPWLRPEYGFARSFGDYRHLHKDATSEHPRGPDINRIAATLIERNRERRFLLYVHYMDVHRPYEPPEPHRGAFTRGLSGEDVFENYGPHPDARPENVAFASGLYTAEVRAFDDVLRELVGSLAELGVADSTLLVVVSDHGEEFHEHGGIGHGFQLFEEVTRVPLLLSHPSLVPSARRIRAPVALVDLLPTLLELTGLPRPERLDGISLAPWILDPRRGEPPSDRLLLSELGDVKALRRGHHKLIRFLGRVEEEHAYDLSRDAGEQHPLTGEPPWRSALRRELEQALSSPTAAEEGEAHPAPAEPAFDALLRELGYAE